MIVKIFFTRCSELWYRFWTPRRSVAYFVGRKRSITELTLEQQQLIRDAYAETGFSHNHSEEGICICTTERKAKAACNDENGQPIPGFFYYALPVDHSLPIQTVDLKSGSTFPALKVPFDPLPWRAVDIRDVDGVLSMANEALGLDTKRRLLETQRMAKLLGDEDLPTRTIPQ